MNKYGDSSLAAQEESKYTASTQSDEHNTQSNGQISHQDFEDTREEQSVAVKNLDSSQDKINFAKVFEDDYLFELLLEYFSLEGIYKHIYPLNKAFKARVAESNYLLLEKFADRLHITSTFLSTDLPAKESIIDIYKDTVKTIEEDKVVNIKPNCFYTDSGLVGTNMWYSMHNIFETNTTMYYGYVFSSNKGTNNHVQAYLWNPGSYDNAFNQKLKSEYELDPGSKEIFVPYNETAGDGAEPTFKIPKVFEINCRNQGYCYYVDNFLLWFSEARVDNKKFQNSTKVFNPFKCVKDVKDSGLPILSINEEEKGFTVIEFDLSKKREMMRIMEINKFVSVPLIYINLDKNITYGKTLKYTFKQNVAAKYMSMKLLCCSNYLTSSQLDMFPCVLRGISLNF